MGDTTRLALVRQLALGSPLSITRLARDATMTRQAITRHLRVLETAGLVRGSRQGRESLFELRPEPFRDARTYLEQVSSHWEDALARLKSFVEQ